MRLDRNAIDIKAQRNLKSLIGAWSTFIVLRSEVLQEVEGLLAASVIPGTASPTLNSLAGLLLVEGNIDGHEEILEEALAFWFRSDWLLPFRVSASGTIYKVEDLGDCLMFPACPFQRRH
jgi:hypothetical protein